MTTFQRVGNARDIAKWKQLEPTPLFQLKTDSAQRPTLSNTVLEDAISSITARTGAPEAIGLHSVLASVVLAAQGIADVQTLGGRAPLSLFFVTIAKSGERKSTCDNLATKVPREIQKERYDKYLAEQTRFEKLREEDHAGAVIDDGQTSPQTPPSDPTMMLQNLTPEGLMRHFENGNPSVAIISSEGGQFFGGHSMKRENRLNTVTTYTQLWDSGSVDRHRASTGSRNFRNKRLSMHLMLQPDLADEALSDPTLIDQGFYSRILVAFPKSTIGTRFVPDVPTKLSIDEHSTFALDAFETRLREVFKVRLVIDKADPLALDTRLLELPDISHQRLLNFANRIEASQTEGGLFAHIQGFAGKCPEHACRLAGALTIFADHTAKAVSDSSMKNAINVIEWHLGEMLRLRDSGYVSRENRDAETLRQWLISKRAGSEITVRDIQKCSPKPTHSADHLRRLLAALVRNDWVLKLPGGSTLNGRKSRDAWLVRDNA